MIKYKQGEKVGNCIYVEDIEDHWKIVGLKSSRRFAKFICNCGNEFISQIDSVKRFATKSCGCLKEISLKKKGKNKTHGMSKSVVYRRWQDIKTRCYNKECESYGRYGAIGITICDEWMDDFERFYEDFGKFYSEGLEIDRIDVTKGYSADNCRWVDKQTQAWNKGVYSNNKTGCSGVTEKGNGKFEARISKDGKEYTIGSFDKLEDAVSARIKVEIEFYGEPLKCKREVQTRS